VFASLASDVSASGLAALLGSIIYGDGTNGIAAFDGANTYAFATKVGNVYTLNRDVFLADGSSVSAISTLKTGGFRLFCNGQLVNDGLISSDGKDAALNVAGAASALGSLGVGLAGGAGRVGIGTGTNGTNQSNALQDASAAGGAGGAGGAPDVIRGAGK